MCRVSWFMIRQGHILSPINHGFLLNALPNLDLIVESHPPKERLPSFKLLTAGDDGLARFEFMLFPLGSTSLES